MHLGKFVLAILVLLILGYGCSEQKQPIKDTNLSLPLEYDIHMSENSHVLIDLTAACSCSWEEEGSESITLRVVLDGTFNSHIVVAGGEDYVTYQTISQRRLTAGDHHLRLELAPDLSRAKDAQFLIYALQVHPVADTAYDRAPLLVGRNGLLNNHSDIPLGLYAEMSDGVTSYVVIFSNEDGGTGAFPAMLLAQWGRLIDTEWAYSWGKGQPADGQLQGGGHSTELFFGRFSDHRPWLETATDNNNFTAWPEGAEVDNGQHLLFSLPLVPAPRGVEATLLDQYPLWMKISNQELRREHPVEVPPNPATMKLPDLRQEWFVDYEGDPLPSVRITGWSATGNSTDADYRTEGLAFSGSNARTALEWPEADSELTGITLTFLQIAPPVNTQGHFRIFRLSEKYVPQELKQVELADLR